MNPKRIILLGMGHTHCHIARQWKSNPLVGGELICVSNSPKATYSGMLPGVLAGDFPKESMDINLDLFCASAGAQLVLDDECKIDTRNRVLEFNNHPPLSFDLLSIGVGSRPTIPQELENSDCIVPIKPMQTFLPRLKSELDRLQKERSFFVRCCIVGGGVAGIEVAFCLQAHLKGLFKKVDLSIVTASDEIAEGAARSTQRKLKQLLSERRIKIITGQRVSKVSSDRTIEFDSGHNVQYDLIFWATSASAPQWFSNLGLAVDGQGFLRTRRTLQSVDCDDVFVVGDSGSLDGFSVPKAGVIAVRQGPVLWTNLNKRLIGNRLVEYRPQSRFLKLINTGDQKAIVEYGRWSAHTRWAWKLKRRIDTRFIEPYQDC